MEHWSEEHGATTEPGEVLMHCILYTKHAAMSYSRLYILQIILQSLNLTYYNLFE